MVPPNAETSDAQAHAQADRADNTMENLCFALVQFLTYVLRARWNSPWRQAQSARRATEQAQSPRDNFIAPECGDIAFDQFEEWSDRRDNHRFYDEPALLLQKQMFDIMRRTKEGLAKENTFLEWCRRVNKHKEVPSSSASIATEHAENCFKSLAVDLLSNDLTPEQRYDNKYKIQKNPKTGEVSVPSKQRSWINVILRKNLGDYRVAYFIFNHGIPALFEEPRRSVHARRWDDQSIHISTMASCWPSKAMLQNMLDEVMTWHASLLQSILEQQKHPDMSIARKLSDLEQTAWQSQRREVHKKVKQRLAQGRRLAENRDSKKRKFEDMSATEQEVLEKFDTGKAGKQHAEACAKKLPRFCGKMLSHLQQ